ncbi:hypothetical protein KO493_00815 [Tamlana agarivorans]|uniref:Uncharacterized protein n=1 Tax=Pseudotamlana agarivorans TaxID=481183 RepID=A0ACC5U4K7_9FLAO|nr:hypothetical protein [Tamlana agarivorans]MBU2949241.1 hypothetical protein [Tamlana agarivorans]
MEYKHRLNWVDGMKINKDHFVGFEDSMMQQLMVMHSNYVHQNNYGLLPSPGDRELPVKLSISMDGPENLLVTVSKCLAVTLGGYQIVINDEVNAFLEQSGHIIKNKFALNPENKICYIVLSVNPFKRIPVGFSNPEEEPVRKPFVIGAYQISLVSETAMPNQEISLNSITIGKLITDSGQARLVDDFIPPCTSIQSHPDLRYAFLEVDTFLNGMELYCTQVIQKIYQKKQANDLAKMVLALSNDVLTYLRAVITTYRIKDKYASPVEMIIKLVSLARTIKGSLDVHAGTGKEHLLNYLTDWCDVNQGAFEKVLDDMISLEYLHNDINVALQKVSGFTALMSALFKKLNELEYIGKKSDSNIFVKEDVIVEEQVKKRRRFFME